MTGHELAERMSAACVTPDRLAESMNRHRDEVSNWLATTARLPKSLSQALEWHLALLARERQMREQDFPPCPWMEQRRKEPRVGRDAFERQRVAVQAHMEVCAICQQRAAYAATLPPLPPVPLPPHLRALRAVALGVGRLPKWARPPAVGALLVGGWMLVRAVLTVALEDAPLHSALLLTVFAAAGVGAYGGLVGGVAYSLVRQPARRLGRIGDYVTGLVCVYAYLVAFGVPLALFAHEDMFRTLAGWIVLLIVGTFFGLLIGYSWFRRRTDPSDSA